MLIGDKQQFTTEPNIFKHGHVTIDTVTADKDYTHGDIYPANDATATGVVYHDTKEGMPLARIIEGSLYADKLPAKPTKAAYDRLRQIEFYDGDNELFIPTV